ncbi:MAG: hypothetical protein QUS14_15280 [Pyrinomonadaceae bacterium]|nr:hypothetical protein [Pyrinomonadaceae bacterium]
MTSEELELSLKAEFESYLSETLAAMRRDVADFQRNFETEFAKHRSQMDEAINALSSRLEATPALDRGFTESVVEHLRLARDEGAQLAASAFSEAEKLQREAMPEARYDLVRDAVGEIGSKMTQVEILSSLIAHAAEFAPRGVFFIVKGDHLVAWRSFGEGSGDNSAADVRVPLTSDTILGAAVTSRNTEEGKYGTHADDESEFISPLGFGRPDRMYAIPLIARGKAVAVLYADYGTEGITMNVEALETLVRVAGLTVELRAAARPAAVPQEVSQAANQYSVPEPASAPEPEYAPEPVAEYTAPEPAAETPAFEYNAPDYVEPLTASEYQPAQFSTPDPAPEYSEPEQVAASVYEFEPTAAEEVVYEEAVVEEAVSYSAEPVAEEASYQSYNAPAYEAPAEPQSQPVSFESYSTPEPVADPVVDAPAYQFQPTPAPEPETVEEVGNGFAFRPSVHVEEPQPEPVASAPEPEFVSGGYAPEPAAPATVDMSATQAGRSRLSERNIDLPIEVSEEERKIHNNARRFARLLVSEIKLYNEQKVTEGREAGDLYNRLREAIDRSREMYDRRVEPAVAAKFDYFHYELLNDLAGGDASKLGAGYPGAVV